MSDNKTSTRIIVSITAIPFIILVSYFGRIFFLIFVLGVALISFYEFSALSKNKSAQPLTFIGLFSIALIIFNIYFNWIDFYLLAIIISVLLLGYELFRSKSSSILNLGVTYLGIFYIGLFASSILQIREFYKFSDQLYEQGGFLIISILATIWICDSAAFFLGSAFGKHKLFPSVSPKKSWEGAIAGFFFALITMIASQFLVLDFLSFTDALIMGGFVGTIGQIGDLIESLIKRDAAVKDSSSLIPGHGGIFDRFDSLIFTAPFIYFYLSMQY